MTEIEISLPRRLRWQSRVVTEAKRFNVLAKGRRAGGTAIAEDLAIDAMLDRKPVGWFSATYKLLAEAERDMLRILGPLIVKRNVSEHRYEILGGGSLEMWTLETDISARGRKYARAVIDEAAHVPTMQMTWEQQIRPCLADLQGDAWFVSSPNGHNYFHTLYERGLDPEWTTWAAWQIPTWRNPLISADEIEAAKAELEDSSFRQEFGAEFVVRSGAVFPSFSRVRNVRRIDPDPHLPIHVGMDFGFRHFAAVMFQLPSNGEVHVIGEYEETERTTAQALQEIGGAPYGNGKPFPDRVEVIGCDPAGAGRNLQTGWSDVGLARRAFPGAHVRFSTLPQHRDPEWRAARIRDLILSADGTVRLFVDERCKRVIRMLENLVYPQHKPGADEKAKPVKDGVHDHLFDALGYGIVNTLHVARTVIRR